MGQGGQEPTVTRMNHVAIAVPDLAAAASLYRDVFGCRVSEPRTAEDHGVTIVYVELGNVNIELMTPHGEDSPIARFLERNPGGGIHHIGVEVLEDAVGDASLQTIGWRPWRICLRRSCGRSGRGLRCRSGSGRPLRCRV